MRAFGHHQVHMTHDALVAFLCGLTAIVFGFLFSAGAPVALAVAVDRVREPRRTRRAQRRNQYPYR
jgi:hypothetical protein